MTIHNAKGRRGRLLLATIMIPGMIAAAAWAQQHGGHGSSGTTPTKGFSAEMHAAMAKMSKDMESMPMTGDPDKDFLSMMIPHHEGAVEMARLTLSHGRDPVVRKMAEEIIVAQQAEITAMKERMEFLKAGRP